MNWKDKKQKENQDSGIETPKVEGIKSVSDADPEAPMHGTTPMTIRMNQYHKDIIAVGAERMEMNKQEIVRLAVRDFLERNGIT